MGRIMSRTMSSSVVPEPSAKLPTEPVFRLTVWARRPSAAVEAAAAEPETRESSWDEDRESGMATSGDGGAAGLDGAACWGEDATGRCTAGGGCGEAGLDAAAAGEVSGAAGFGAAAEDEVKGAAGFGGDAGGGDEGAAGFGAAADEDGAEGAAGLGAVAGGDEAAGLDEAAADAGDEAGFGGAGGGEGGAALAAPLEGESSVTISVRSRTSSSSLSAAVRALRSWAFGLLTGLVSPSSFSDMIRRMEDRISSMVGS